MNKAEVIELAEVEIARLIDVIHRQGLSYWQILDLVLRAACDLHLRAGAEYEIKRHL